MKVKNGVTMSDKGSVRYAFGTFYDNQYTELFVPLDDNELRQYFNEVDEAERRAGRPLSRRELETLFIK